MTDTMIDSLNMEDQMTTVDAHEYAISAAEEAELYATDWADIYDDLEELSSLERARQKTRSSKEPHWK